MRLRPALLTAPLAAALVLPAQLAGAAPSTASFTDPANDANGLNMALLNTAVSGTEPFYGNNPTPAGSQAPGDVLSVTWKPVLAKKKMTGFTVTATFSAPPVAPAGRNLVYRMLSVVKGDTTKTLGVVYYTSSAEGPNQSAVRDTLGKDAAVRLKPIAHPKITGSTMTWTVPMAAIPAEFERGTSVTNLFFEVRELEYFGMTMPKDVAGEPVPVVGGSSGLAVPAWDNGRSTTTFQIG